MSTHFEWNLILSEIPEIDESVSKRSSHTINHINGKLYIFGGEYVPRNPINSDLLVFDTKTKTWSKIQSDQAPSPRVGHSSCTLNNVLYIFGGRNGVNMGETSLNDLYAFDTIEKTWSKFSQTNDSEEWPEKRSYHSMTALKDKLYIFGGCSKNGGRLNDLFEYDLNTNKWTRLPGDDQIVARGGSSLCSYESQDETKETSCLYLIGGFCGHELDDCYKFDLKKKIWSKVENLPKKLSVFACSSTCKNSNLRLVLHGGEIDPSTSGHNGAGEFSNDTYVYDGSKWTCLQLNLKPTSRGWHHACFDEINNKFYIYGGNLENNFRTNELWCLNFK